MNTIDEEERLALVEQAEHDWAFCAVYSEKFSRALTFLKAECEAGRYDDLRGFDTLMAIRVRYPDEVPDRSGGREDNEEEI